MPFLSTIGGGSARGFGRGRKGGGWRWYLGRGPQEGGSDLSGNALEKAGAVDNGSDLREAGAGGGLRPFAEVANARVHAVCHGRGRRGKVLGGELLLAESGDARPRRC